MFSAIASVVTTLLLGAIGWIGAAFFARHIVKFYDLRGRVREELYYTANVPGWSVDKEHVKEAQDHLRRLAAQLAALEVALTPPLPKLVAYLGYDLKKAAEGMTGLANSLVMTEDALQGVTKAQCRTKAEEALKLPRFYSNEDIENLGAALINPPP